MIYNQIVSIIGGGLTGSLIAINLLRKSLVPIKIVLIEKNRKHIGRGIAYDPISLNHILNVQAKHMSLFSNEPNHFINWWVENKNSYLYLNKELNEDSFFPRFIFGDYIHICLNQEIHLSKSKHDMNFIVDEVVDLSSDRNWTIHLKSGNRIIADTVYLATGNIPPSDPIQVGEEIHSHRKYISNPWEDSAIEGLERDRVILIIGSGLTMIDHIISIFQTEFSGRVYVLSRSGKLPQLYENLPIKNIPRVPNLSGT